MSDLVKKNERKFNLGDFVLDNIVTIIFWVFIILGLALAKSVTFNWFLTELSNRFYRNAFLVLSLIIPVIAGLLILPVSIFQHITGLTCLQSLTMMVRLICIWLIV